jgi:hypothetical protein
LWRRGGRLGRRRGGWVEGRFCAVVVLVSVVLHGNGGKGKTASTISCSEKCGK